MAGRIFVNPQRGNRIKYFFIIVALALILFILYRAVGSRSQTSDQISDRGRSIGDPLTAVSRNKIPHSDGDPPNATPVASIESRSQQFDRLAKGTPAEALLALKLLEPCETADLARMRLSAPTGQNDDDAWRQKERSKIAETIKKSDSECLGITSGQRLEAISLALKAANSGVPGGFDALVRQETLSTMGADRSKGDPRDSRIIEQMPAIWQSYINAGDPHALMAAYQHYSNCTDPPECKQVDLRMALVHWTAYVDTGASKFPTEGETARLIALLTPETARAAIAEGHSLYASRTGK